MQKVSTVGIIGTGVIGAGWASRALARGLNVIAWDPAPDAESKLRAAVANAWPAVSKLGLFPGAAQDRLQFAGNLVEVCAAADFIQEAAPEREDLKRRLHAQMDAAAKPHIIIASSTSGLLPTVFQRDCKHPERIIVGHPFNPVYLLPLVEVLGGAKTAPDSLHRAMAFYQDIGMYPLRVRKEIPGFLSDRLQEALWREALHLVNDGVATTAELDAAIAYGPGLRWAIWGTCLIFHLAGGEGGMRHMLAHFDPSLFPWTKLEAPPISDELLNRMAEGCEQQAAGRSIQELEQLRDNCLIAIMQALRSFNEGAGAVLKNDEARRIKTYDFEQWQATSEIAKPLSLYQCTVLPEWVDYNNHMTESAYLEAAGWASDALFRYIGIDENYRAAGCSFYTVESHVLYFQEANTGEPLRITTQVLGLDAKRLHFIHHMYHGHSGELLSTVEQMLLHVDSKASKACNIQPQVYRALAAIRAAHNTMPVPEQVGRIMQIKSPSV